MYEQRKPLQKSTDKRSLEEEKEEKHSNRSEGNSDVWSVFKNVKE